MNVRKLSLGFVALTVVVVAIVLSFRDEPVQPLKQVVLQLPWTASAGYAGFYLADTNGDYAREGLKVNFAPGGPGFDPVAVVTAGKAQIGITNGAKVIEARASGMPIKAVACIYRRNPLVYITLQSSGITHPRQFANRTIRASKQNTVILKAMIAPHDVDFGTIKIVKSNDVGQLVNGEIDVWSGHAAVSLEAMKRAGIKVNVMHPENFGIYFYNSCIFTTDEMIRDNRETVLGFLRASLKYGWPSAFRDPDMAAEVVKSYGVVSKLEVEAKTISVMLPLVDMGTGNIGTTDSQVWSDMIGTLRKQGLIDTDLDVKDVFDPIFLEAIFTKQPKS